MDEQFWAMPRRYLPINNGAGDEVISSKTQKIGETFQWALSHTNLEDLQELTESKSATKNSR